MRDRWAAPICGVFSALMLGGCASAGVRYSGEARAPAAAPVDVVSGDRPPAGHRRLGRVSADCEPLGSAPLEKARHSDLACSRELLLAAVKERAAAAGGDFLTSLECSGGSRFDCRAEVWGPESGVKRKPRTPAERAELGIDPLAPVAPGAPPYGSVSDAWRTEVEFVPHGSAAAQRGGRPRLVVHEVAEIDFPRAGFVPLGDVKASCREGCAEQSLRSALRATAAWVGASSLVGVRCAQSHAGLACIASVAAPEVDERTLAGAR